MKSIKGLLNKKFTMAVEDALAISIFTLINQIFRNLNLIYFLIVFLPLWIAFKIVFMKDINKRENEN